MKHIIIGTAGHIDHGKTALIRALTGRDTDQTKEEKERGISINLGFTYFDLPENNKAGIIDVPGHEKFLPNMLSGVCGMDMILLVIALDEGIMPQTTEHMDIIEQMNITNGIVVLTKLDKVDAEWAELMSEEICGKLKGTLFESWPVVRISAMTGEGISELKHLIVEIEKHISRNRSTSGPFRMPIDRIISLKGLGTLVCGTVMEGRVFSGEELQIFPSGRIVKVRNIQTHGIDMDETGAGQRTSLLVSNVKKEEIKRGMTIAEIDSLPSTERIDAKIQMTRHAEHMLKNQSRMHLHIGTGEVICRVVLYQKESLSASEEGYAQLITEQNISVRGGDRFLLRFYSPLETIAGGIVIDANAKKKKRNADYVIEELKKREENKIEEIIMHFMEEKNVYPLTLSEIVHEIREESMLVDSVLNELVESRHCVKWNGKKSDYYWEYSKALETENNLERYLKKYHVQYPYRFGCDKNEIKIGMFPEWKLEWFELLLRQLEKENRIQIRNNLIALESFRIQIDDALEALAEKICPRLEEAGFQFVDYMQFREANQSKMQYNDMIECLIELGILVRISKEFVTTAAVAGEAEQKVRDYFHNNEILSYSQLRDLLQSTRKSVRPLMNYLDQKKVTEWFGHETERREFKERRESVEE